MRAPGERGKDEVGCLYAQHPKIIKEKPAAAAAAAAAINEANFIYEEQTNSLVIMNQKTDKLCKF